MTLANLLAALPGSLPQEEVEAIAAGSAFRLERIVSTGQTTPLGQWYDQTEAEWVLLLAGEAELEFADGENIRLKPGDHLLIPARRRHRVSFTSTAQPTVWLALFFAP